MIIECEKSGSLLLSFVGHPQTIKILIVERFSKLPRIYGSACRTGAISRGQLLTKTVL